MARLLGMVVTLSASLAFAASSSRTSGGGGCCSLVFFALFVWIYRSGGADWGRAVGTALLPGVFGWFIWRDRDLGTGARWVALITAIFQVASLVLTLIAVLFLGAFVAKYSKQLQKMDPQALVDDDDDAKRPKVDLSNVPEDPSLGLHPPASITTDPPGATVYVDGQKRGVTPLETPLTAGKRNEIKVVLAGYFPTEQTREPNARERLSLRFTLQPAAQLELETTPPGARVFIARKQVLARTPGLTDAVEVGEAELLVVAAGHLPSVQTLKLAAGVTPLEVALTPGTPLTVTSTPPESEVFVDGTWVGLAPVTIGLSPKGKHTVEVKKETWATAKRVFAGVTKPQTWDAKLVDTEQVQAKAAVARARARYDRVEAALGKVQEKMDSHPNPPAKLVRQREVLDREMAAAAQALEEAEARLKTVEEARAAEDKPAAFKGDVVEDVEPDR